MSSQPLLESRIDDRDTLIAGLKSQLSELREELRIEREKVKNIEPALKELRRVTLPFFNILRAVHGEIEALGFSGNGASPSGHDAENNSRWEAIKKRNPGKIAEAIDILLIHGSMNTNTLKSAMKISYENCRVNVVGKLSGMGLLAKNGKEFSLRSL